MYIFEPIRGATNYFWRIIGLIVATDNNCCHGYDKGEEAGNVQYQWTFPEPQKYQGVFNMICMMHRCVCVSMARTPPL